MEDNFIWNHYIAKYCKYRVGYYKNDSGQKDYNYIIVNQQSSDMETIFLQFCSKLYQFFPAIVGYDMVVLVNHRQRFLQQNCKIAKIYIYIKNKQQ